MENNRRNKKVKQKILLNQKSPEEKLVTINRIFFEAKLSLNSYYSIAWNNNLDASIDLPPYLKFLSYLVYKNFVIEICKLLNQTHNEYYNLFSLIKEFENVNYYKLEVSELERFFDELNSLKNEHFKELLDARNQVYAHTDPNHKKIKMVMGNHITGPVMKLVGEIIDYLNSSVKIEKFHRYNKHGSFHEHDFYDLVINNIVNKNLL